jgi:hypothetical protein
VFFLWGMNWSKLENGSSIQRKREQRILWPGGAVRMSGGLVLVGGRNRSLPLAPPLLTSKPSNNLITTWKPMLPGGQNFGQKAQKGPEKKKVGLEESEVLSAEFYQKWQKRGRRIISEEVPYLTVQTHFQRRRKTLISFWIDHSCVFWIYFFVKSGEHFLKLAELFWCTGRKTLSGPGNTGENKEQCELR